MLKRAWIVMGEQNTKKSSVVRGLTTADNGATWVEIETFTGLRFCLQLFISSLQEARISPDEMIKALSPAERPARITQEIYHEGDVGRALDLGIKNALIPLRYDAIGAFPGGLDYVERLVSESWKIEAIVSLGELERLWVRRSGIPYGSVPGSATSNLPGSKVAAEVRSFFGWR